MAALLEARVPERVEQRRLSDVGHPNHEHLHVEQRRLIDLGKLCGRWRRGERSARLDVRAWMGGRGRGLTDCFAKDLFWVVRVLGVAEHDLLLGVLPERMLQRLQNETRTQSALGRLN